MLKMDEILIWKLYIIWIVNVVLYMIHIFINRNGLMFKKQLYNIIFFIFSWPFWLWILYLLLSNDFAKIIFKIDFLENIANIFNISFEKQTEKEKYEKLKEEMIIKAIRKREFKYKYPYINKYHVINWRKENISVEFKNNKFNFKIYEKDLQEWYYIETNIEKVALEEILKIEKEKKDKIKAKKFAEEQLEYAEKILELNWYKENKEVKKEFEPVFDKARRLKEIIKEVNEIKNS